MKKKRLITEREKQQRNKQYGFVPGPWHDAIDVRDFIQRNYTPYTGDASFLSGPTERTLGIWAKLTA
ncbi:MAG TPA: hypothetical protein VGC08_12365, partial [Pedobacter sp.]